ncbi:hypothetical protein FB45DRAFT_997988, partial [Roridomyces roridus]
MSSAASTIFSETATSPLAAHLSTNYCPTDEEIVEIKELIAGPSLRVHALDDEIAAVYKRLHSLKAEREDLVAHIESYRALISPVRRLPLDIVQHIFMSCLPDRNCVMGATEAPLLLGRICGLWRATALSMPLLLSRIHIVAPHETVFRPAQA